MSIFQIEPVPQFWTFVIAMLPIIELRGAIPIAINVYGLSRASALLWGVLGSVTPALPILWMLGFLEPHLRKIKEIDRLLDAVYAKTRHKGKLIEEYEMLGLILFIGIPLPGTGVWTGMLAAYLFGLNRFVSLICALIGTTLAGIIMLFMSDFQNIFSVIGAIVFVIIAAIVIKLQLKNGKKNENSG